MPARGAFTVVHAGRLTATSDSFYIDSIHSTGHLKKQLLDNGSHRELMSDRYCTAMKFARYELKEKLRLVYMDGSRSEVITHGTQQTYSFHGRKMRIRYAIADIDEDIVLGLNWLRQCNPVIDWVRETISWRPPQETTTKVLAIQARGARKRIVQSDIKHNEPPEWVKRHHAAVLMPRKRGTLPPSRGELDYVIKMKEDWKPRREKPRRFSDEERKMFRALAEDMVEQGFWIPNSKSPQCSQMLWAAKAGGKKRPCHDYRYVNTGIVDDAYPVPVISDLMMDLAGKKHLTSLDLPNAYYNILISDPFTRQMLAFQCGEQQYEPAVVQFGSKTAVAWFQRFITWVLRRNIGKGVMAYLDNIVIYADTQEEHDRLVKETLDDLYKEDLRVRPEKCEWDKQEVFFCGYLVSADGIRLDPAKLEAVRDWKIDQSAPEAQKRTAVREFLGFCNFYKTHVDHYSDIAIPLTDLTAPRKPWKWGDREELAFRALKQAILLSPVVKPRDHTKPAVVHTDASDDAVAGVVQERGADGTLRPLGFYSKKLNPAERNYTVHDKELLAIVRTFEAFRHWLHGTKDPVEVWSDHAALRHFLTTTKLTQRHARWAEKLGEFRFKIFHLPGRANRAADALSRKESHSGQAVQKGGVSPLSAEHFARKANEGAMGRSTAAGRDTRNTPAGNSQRMR